MALRSPVDAMSMIEPQISLQTRQSQSSPVKARVQFPGLNTIRFYAALAVIVEHVGIQFSPNNLFKIVNLFFVNAQHAVNLFFVLSGFLITYLLLDERAATGRIDIRNFYIRRALRIWPLYYWVVLLGLVIFPRLFGSSYPLSDLPEYKLILALTFLPNFASITAPMIHLWSIGVEEQFYASWPWAAKNDATILRVIFGIIILKLSLTPIILSFNNDGITTMFYGLRFECMAIGALGAYIYLKKPYYLKWMYAPLVQISALGAFACLAIFNIPINTYNIAWSSLAYIVLIANVATNQHSLLRLNFPFSEKLGEVSYGLYLYHFPVLYLISVTADKTGLERIWTSPSLLLITTLISTWAIAAISYRWFETPFLKLKKKFATN